MASRRFPNEHDGLVHEGKGKGPSADLQSMIAGIFYFSSQIDTAI